VTAGGHHEWVAAEGMTPRADTIETIEILKRRSRAAGRPARNRPRGGDRKKVIAMNTGLPKPPSETIDAAGSGERRGEVPAARGGPRRGPRGALRAFVGRFAPKSIVGQVALLNGLAIACLIGVASYQLVGYRDGLWADRRHELTTLVEAASSIVNSEYAAAQSGQESVDAAQANAEKQLARLRYGAGDYVWINDMQPRMVMHPIKPEMNGQDLSDYKDPNGKKLFVEMTDAVRQSGSGFVSYEWPKPGKDKPQPKLSYVAEFKPWSWVIGTGVYVDDLDEVFLSRLKTEGALVFLVIAFCAAASVAMGRKLARPIVSMSIVMEQLAAGNLDLAPADGTTRARELDRMSRALNVFRQNALERARLESEAATTRALTEAEREQASAERTKAAKEQTEAVQRLGFGLKEVAGGDLMVRLTDGFTPAYAQIRDDFNVAIDKLKATIVSVVDSTGSIETSAKEVSAAADDLSRRTEQQAASLEQTTATLTEVTAAVKTSAEGTLHARQVVAAADEDARKSATVVRQAVEAMSAIAKSSKQISQIIGVIDEIAFQTNLLALNAGVEAARAGEAGRGFAVVASEVRALAQRSAGAAKEIKGLISDSSAQVGIGVELVAETGRSLERIAAQVAEINAAVSDIAGGAHEQSTALQEINTAIEQMNLVTQQNAAMVEESTAAGHSLSEETSKLSHLMGQFRVGRAAGESTLRAELAKAAPHAFRTPAKAARPAATGRSTLAVATAGGAAAAEGWQEF
jgi:methyl-accepting chemotaxis protein